MFAHECKQGCRTKSNKQHAQLGFRDKVCLIVSYFPHWVQLYRTGKFSMLCQGLEICECVAGAELKPMLLACSVKMECLLQIENNQFLFLSLYNNLNFSTNKESDMCWKDCTMFTK